MAMPEGEAGEPESGRGARTRAARSTMAEADLTTCSIAQARVDRKGRRITPSDHASSRAVGRRAGRAPRGEQAGHGSALPPTGDYGDAVL